MSFESLATEEEAALNAELAKSQSHRTVTHLYQFNTSVTAPSQNVAKAIVTAATSVAALDAVSVDARSLTSSLANLSQSAEAAVRQVRQLDGLRMRIQLALERVEDVMDLQTCLAGVSTAIERRDFEAAALHVKRFRSLEGHLPVFDSDIAFMKQAETTLLDAVQQEFDAAIKENQEYQQTKSQQLVGTNKSKDAIEKKISHCCQLMNVLGHAEMGLKRYIEYLKQNYDGECQEYLISLASEGVERPVTALNTLSQLFGRAAELFDMVTSPATATMFGTEGAARRLLINVHSVCDKHAAKIIRSVARSGRFQAALVARERLLKGEEAKPTGKAEPAPPATAAEASLAVQQLDKDAEAPFVVVPAGSISSSRFKNADFLEPPVYDAFLDELALMIQRCASYIRLLHMKAAEVDSLRDPSSVDSTEGSIKTYHRIKDSMAELGGCYSVLEQSKIQGAVNKAIALDELVEDGVAGASVDLVSNAALQLLETPIHLLSKVSETSTVEQSALESISDVSGLGDGALITTVVEDSLYVCARAIKRAMATGSADCVAGVINNVVLVLSDKLANELTARLNLALEDLPGAKDESPFAVALSSAQRERLSKLGNRIMNSSPMKMAAARLADLQVLPGAGISRVMSPGVSSPLVSRNAKSAHTPVPDSSLPAAKLTQDVAATALALNNLQLSVACLGKLSTQMYGLARETFPDQRELEKVNTSLSGLLDVQQQFKKTLERGINTLCTSLTPRLRSAINVFEGASSLIQYELDEERFMRVSEGFNAFLTEFLPVLSSITAPYQYALTPPIAFVVLSKIAGYISKQLEPRIRRKRFSQLGALQFDADIRALVTFFVDRTSRKTRQRFSRLLEMAQVLNVEVPDEVLDYTNATTTAGKLLDLTADEIRSILTLRTDFKASDIAKLKL